MGTRIQDKSRPTKRPMADYGPGGYGRVHSGKPKTDLKGYPITNGIPVPVLVDANANVPPGTVRLGPWVVGDATALGQLQYSALVLEISESDANAINHSVALAALAPGDTVYIATASGSNTLTVTSSTDSGTFFTIVASAEAPTGTIAEGQAVLVWATP